MTNQFDLLKSHIEAYTRKDGSVVGAHDDKRVSHKEGDAVKVTGNVNGQGKTGVIQETAPSGHFHIVKHSDGSKASYHESDLSAHDEDEDDRDEDDRDEDDEDHEVLKSHIDAYARKDGAVVQAHDDKRLSAAANTAHRAGVVANRATIHTSGNDKFKVAASTSHADAASLHQSAAGHHAKAAKMFQDAIAAGENTKQNTEAAAFHAKQAEMHGSHARTHAVMHKTTPNGVASRIGV